MLLYVYKSLIGGAKMTEAKKDESRSTEEMLAEVLRCQKKRLWYMRITSIVIVLFVIILTAALFRIVPRAAELVDQVHTEVKKVDRIIDEDVPESLANINKLVTDTDKMMENVNGVLDENTDAVTDTVKKLNEIDFDSLNDAIKNLNDVVKPLSDFFKGFGR